jgi:peptidoglycan/LPS O-acetylase OafA/YrhL
VLLLGILRAIDLRVIAVLIVIGMVSIWFDTASSQYFSGSALWLLAFFASGMALYRLRDSGFINGRLALVACAGLALSVPLHAFILLFPIFGSYLVIYLAFAPWLKPLPAARFGDLSYGLYIYGWPIEQAIVWLNGGAMSWWALFAIALPVTAVFAFISWHLVEKRALRFKPRSAAPASAKLAPVAVER